MHVILRAFVRASSSALNISFCCANAAVTVFIPWLRSALFLTSEAFIAVTPFSLNLLATETVWTFGLMPANAFSCVIAPAFCPGLLCVPTKLSISLHPRWVPGTRGRIISPTMRCTTSPQLRVAHSLVGAFLEFTQCSTAIADGQRR